MTKNQIINLQHEFKNSSSRDCSWDYMNGVVEHYDSYYYEEGYEEDALLIDIHVKNSSLLSELFYMHNIFANVTEVLDFILAVNKMQYCQKHGFNGIILLKSRTVLNWFIAGRLTCPVQNDTDIDEVILSLGEAIDWLNVNGCDYGLAMDLDSEYGIYNPRTGHGFRVSKLDVGFVSRSGK